VQVKAFPANCQRKIKQLALNDLRHQKVKIRFYFAKRLYYKFVTVWCLQRQMLKRRVFRNPNYNPEVPQTLLCMQRELDLRD
jgi:hypothetical protein